MQGQGLGDWPCALSVCQPDAFFNQTFNYDVWLTHSDCDAADAPDRMTTDAVVEAVGSCELGLTKKRANPNQNPAQNKIANNRSAVPKNMSRWASVKRPGLLCDASAGATRGVGAMRAREVQAEFLMALLTKT